MKTIESGTLPSMKNMHMCEKMPMLPARDNLSFFPQKDFSVHYVYWKRNYPCFGQERVLF